MHNGTHCVPCRSCIRPLSYFKNINYVTYLKKKYLPIFWTACIASSIAASSALTIVNDPRDRPAVSNGSHTGITKL